MSAFSSKRSAITIDLEPGRSGFLAWFHRCLHGLAVLAVGLSNVPPGARILLAAGIFLHFWLSLRERARTQSPRRLRMDSERRWEVMNGAGAFSAIEPLASTVVCRFFVLLHYREGRHRRTWMIVRDALDENDFRALRVAVRIAALGPAEAMRQPPQ